jgi:hypothetical protein
VGAGRSQEASYTLKAAVPAGTYHFVLDAIIVKPVDVTFDLIWRRDSTDIHLTTWTEHYAPLAGGSFDAQAFEYDQASPAIEWQHGDQLIFRYTGNAASAPSSYVPNGDGAFAHGRIPNLTLP